MKNVGDFSNLDALLRDIQVRLERQERHTHIFPTIPPIIVTVPTLPPEPEPEPVDCEDFCDEFTGTVLGSPWTEGPAFDYGSSTPVIENAISTGAFIAGQNDNPAPQEVSGSIRSIADFPSGPQYVEVVTGNWFQGHAPALNESFQWVEGEFWLYSQLQANGTCLAAYCIISVAPGAPLETSAYMQLVRRDASGESTFYGDGQVAPLALDWQTNHSYTYRLETDETGHCRGFVDGTMVVAGDLPPVVGDGHVGVALKWNRTNYGDTLPINPGVSPRMESFCGGCLVEASTAAADPAH